MSAEDRRAHPEHDLGAVLALAQDGVFLSDAAGRYVAANDAGCRMLGRTRAELVGKTVFDVIPREDAERMRELLARARSGPMIFEWTLHREDGSTLDVEVSTTTGPSGERQSILRDISERKRTDARIRRLATIVRDSNDAITVQDLTGCVLAWNQGAERMYGYSEAEALGMNIAVIVPEGDLGSLSYLGAVGRGEACPARAVRRRAKDGRVLDVWLTTTRLVADDGAISVATTERDVTEQGRIEREQQLDLEAMERLHHVGLLFLSDREPAEIITEILDAAIAISEADFGNVQVADPDTARLRIVAQRGFSPRWLAFWASMPEHRGVCGTALGQRERVIVEDVTESPIFAGTEALAVQLEAGVRAVQSTPLITASGACVGMLSTHYRAPRRPSDRALRMLDLLARKAAGIIERTRSEAALRRAEARASGVLAASADAIIVLDDVLRVTEWNAAAERIFGYSRAEALGETLDRFVPERYRAAHREHVAGFASEPTSPRVMDHEKTVGLRKNGEEFPISAMIAKVEVDGKRLLIASVRDVTGQRRAAEEQRALAEMGAALASLDYEDTLRQVPRIAAFSLADFAVLFVVGDDGEPRRVAAAGRDPALTWCVDQVMSAPTGLPPGHPARQVMETRRSIMVEVPPEQYASLAESPEYLRVLQAAQVRFGLIVPLIAADRCLGALALSSATRAFEPRDLDLAEEIGRRCALFIENARRHRAEERAVQARNETLGIVAHDLRNPLHTILLVLARLRLRGNDPHRLQKTADMIERAANHMNRIIEDLLDVSRLEAGQLAVEQARVPAATIIAEAVEGHAPQVAARSLELQREPAEELPEVLADADRIRQVFENLIGNAMKFTTSGGIRVGARQGDGEVLFWVADTGSGIPPEDVPHVFDRFWQAKKTSRSGAGLGLAIVKGIVEVHGGRVWVESQLGAGTTFFFTLPIAAVDGAHDRALNTA